MTSKITKNIFIIIFLLLVLSSCDDKVSSPNLKEASLASNTHLNHDLILNITPLQISIDKDNSLSKAEVGDIIMSASRPEAPEGFLRKVLSKNILGNTVDFETSNASLLEAFNKLNLQRTISLTPDQIVDFELFNECLYDCEEDADDYNFVFNSALYDQDNNRGTVDDQIVISGNIKINLGMGVNISIENQELNNFSLETTMEKEGNLNLNVKNINNFAEDTKIALATMKFYPQTIIVDNIPIVITPRIDLSLQINGNYDFICVSEVVLEESSRNGISYEAGSWQAIGSSQKELNSTMSGVNKEYNVQYGMTSENNYKLYDLDLVSIISENSFNFLNELSYDDAIHELNNTVEASLINDINLEARVISSQMTDLVISDIVYSEPINQEETEIEFLNDLIFIEGGDFVHDGLSKRSTINDFYISRYEITQAQFEAVMGYNPSTFAGWNKPVETVSWYEAVKFCNKLSIKEGFSPRYYFSGCSTNPDTWPEEYYFVQGPESSYSPLSIGSGNGYCLPSSLQWRYVADQGLSHATLPYSGSSDCNEVAHYAGNNEPYGTKPVGTKQANSYGVHDLNGNVGELMWTLDYGQYKSADRILILVRGGGWNSDEEECKIKNRVYQQENDKMIDVGFRVVRNAADSSAYTVDKPYISYLSDIYFQPITVSISSVTPGATIRYTIDGSEPTEESALFEGPFLVENTCTLSTKAFKENWNPSRTTWVNLYVYPLVPPVVNPVSGYYSDDVEVNLSCHNWSNNMYYSKNMSWSHHYYNPFTVDENTIVLAWVKLWDSAIEDYVFSDTVYAEYEILSESMIASPVISPNGCSYPGPLTVTLSHPISFINIYYTLDGSLPTTESSIYRHPLQVSESCTLRTYAYEVGEGQSRVAEALFTIEQE